MGDSSESTPLRPGSLAGPGATTLPLEQRRGHPMADVQCPECRERFSLEVGTSLHIWQNAMGQVIEVLVRCPKCLRVERLPIKSVIRFGSVPLPQRELSLRGKDDGHHLNESPESLPVWSNPQEDHDHHQG